MERKTTDKMHHSLCNSVHN